MTVYQIIDTLNNFIPINEDYEEKNNESYFSQIMEFIKTKEDLELTIEPIFLPSNISSQAGVLSRDVAFHGAIIYFYRMYFQF